MYNSENLAGRYESAQVSSDGKYLYFISGWHGAANIYRANIKGEPEIIKFTDGEHTYRSIGEVQNGKMAVLRVISCSHRRYILWTKQPETNSRSQTRIPGLTK